MTGLAVLRKYLKISGLIVLVFTTQTAVAGKTIYVDDDATGANNGSTWADAYNYLQDALADANSAEKPVEIRVAQGIYRPDQGAGITPGDRGATFCLINGVAIRGGYAGFGQPDPNARSIHHYETILTGDLAGNDIEVNDPRNLLDEPTRGENSHTVVSGSPNAAASVLDGVSIAGGNNNVRHTGMHYGAGMDNSGGSPTLVKCTFRANSTAGSGGGMRSGPAAEPTLTGCTFVGNSANDGGGGMNSVGSARLIGCAFKANYGGGMSGGGDWILTDCTFEGNKRGGMYNGGGSPLLTGCRFISNLAEKGAGIYNYCSAPTLINCTFIGNYAQRYGGGMYNGKSEPTLRNCTFGGNLAPNGSALACDSFLQGRPSTVQIINCIVWDGGDEIWNNDGSEIKISHSDLQGGEVAVYDPCDGLVWGPGNIDANPAFAGPNRGDYHLKSQGGRWEAATQTWITDEVTSPCIDAGDPASPVGQEPFPNGGRINMGAYGGTAEASKSYFGEPVCQTIIAGDINGDCKVDFQDLAILASHWLEDNTPPGPVTSTYEFLPDQSTMVWHVGRAGWSIPHSIEGQFKLMVDFDAGIARLEQVDAVLTNGQPPPTHPGVNLNGRRLDDCFHMTELISKDVSLAAIYFEGVFEDSLERIVMELKLLDHSVHLTATTEWSDVVHDASIYSLDAVAVVVTEP